MANGLPSWAYPLRTTQEVYRNSNDRMSRSTAEAIDQAMAYVSETKVKTVTVKLTVETKLHSQLEKTEVAGLHDGSQHHASIYRGGVREESRARHNGDLDWVRVVLTADPGVRMEDFEDQTQRRRKEHRRVPSIVAIEEVKVSL